MNNNPSADFQIFLSWNPQEQGATTNRNEAGIQYNTAAGKWYVSNANQNPLFARVTYNIIISSVGKINTKQVINNAVQIKELVTTVPIPNSNSGIITLMFMTAWADGVKLPGDNFFAQYQDKNQILDFEIGALKPYPSGKPGKAAYEPVTIKIHTGRPVTVPFFNAFAKNQSMAFTIDAFSNDNTGSGAIALNYTIKLSGANIVGFKQVYQEKGLHLGQEGMDKKFFDEIKIIFTKIEFIKDGKTVEDNL